MLPSVIRSADSARLYQFPLPYPVGVGIALQDAPLVISSHRWLRQSDNFLGTEQMDYEAWRA
jgi:hypothetical protein